MHSLTRLRCPRGNCSTKNSTNGFKNQGDLIRHIQEQHTSTELLCPIDGCRFSHHGKDLKRRYRLVKHLMAPIHTRARGLGFNHHEAERRADLAVDAVREQRALVAQSFLGAASPATFQDANPLQNSASLAAAENPFQEPDHSSPIVSTLGAAFTGNSAKASHLMSNGLGFLDLSTIVSGPGYCTGLCACGGIPWDSFVPISTGDPYSMHTDAMSSSSSSDPPDYQGSENSIHWNTMDGNSTSSQTSTDAMDTNTSVAAENDINLTFDGDVDFTLGFESGSIAG